MHFHAECQSFDKKSRNFQLIGFFIKEQKYLFPTFTTTDFAYLDQNYLDRIDLNL